MKRRPGVNEVESNEAVDSDSGEMSEGRGPHAPRLIRATLEWVRSVFIALLIFLVIRTFLIEAFKIPTGSMEGTLLVGDFLLVNKVVYGAEVPGTDVHLPALQEPAVGDVIVFHPPHDPANNYVKRVVGAPGDTLEMKRKVLYRNGVPIDEPYAVFGDLRDVDAVDPAMRWQLDYLMDLDSYRRYRPSRDNWGPLRVPREKFFVLGDNRDNSADSRYWGFVDREAVMGRPWFVYYSFNPNGEGRAPWLKSVRWGRIGGLIR